MPNPLYLPDHGAHSLPGLSCNRCKRALPKNERITQDGEVVCRDCVYTHSKAEYEKLVSTEYPEYRGPLIIGGRTG